MVLRPRPRLPEARAAETAASVAEAGIRFGPDPRTIRHHRVRSDPGRRMISPFDLVACLQTRGRLGELRSPSRECIGKASRELPSYARDRTCAATMVPCD